MGLFTGKNLRARLTQPADEWWDRRLGVNTFGYHPGSGAWGDGDWASHYQPASYRDLFEVLRVAGAAPDDLFTDLGAGLGRAVFAAAHAGVGRAVGVELVPALADAAERNRSASRLRDRAIRFVASDALVHPLGDTTLLYTFHSLSAQVLGEVLARARQYRLRLSVRRPLRLIYMNPVFEHVLASAGWLEPMADLPPRRERLSTAPHYRTVIWRSTDQ